MEALKVKVMFAKLLEEKDKLDKEHKDEILVRVIEKDKRLIRQRKLQRMLEELKEHGYQKMRPKAKDAWDDESKIQNIGVSDSNLKSSDNFKTKNDEKLRMKNHRKKMKDKMGQI